MKKSSFILSCIISGIFFAELSGCGRPAPTAPEIEPEVMAKKALELYDANGDGKISGDELDKTPALAFSLKEMDTDKDRALSAAEIQSRLEAWQNSGITLTAPAFVCKIKGKTVKEGTMRLVPEAFLGETYPIAEGTFINGTCQLRAPNKGNYQAIPLGFYNVEVSSPAGNISVGAVGVEVFDESKYFQRNHMYHISD
ncbi:MAG: hypothetical protein Q4C70_08425 [Planctomycetia bacterium]|nr:hypothetical protein [Planctomycetia bacterium]